MSRTERIPAPLPAWVRLRFISLLAAAVCSGVTPTTTASGSQPPPRAVSSAASGVFVKEEFARTAAKPGRDEQVMFIEELRERGELLVLTNRDARSYTRDGSLIRSVKFPKTLWAPIVTTLAPGDEPVIVGLRVSNLEMLGGPQSRIDVLSLSGQRITDTEGWKYGDVVVSDVTGDASKEILVRFRDGAKVFDARGRFLAFVRAADYVYQLQAIDADADGKDDLVFWMASKKRGEAVVQVSTAAGRDCLAGSSRTRTDFQSSATITIGRPSAGSLVTACVSVPLPAQS